MRIALVYESLEALGGVETYLVLLAERLEGLGHEALIVVNRVGEAAARARELAVTVVAGSEALPAHVDAVIANDAASAYELAVRYPAAARVFVAHSTDGEFAVPPPALPQAIVALNDRLAAWVAARPGAAEIVRLRQPVDVERFAPIRPARERATRLCAFGNYHRGTALADIEACCERLGWELDHVGQQGSPSPYPEHALQRADVVLGIGRCAIEGMACGAATYVLGPIGADGWVTPASYPAIEADGFSGRATGEIVSRARLLADLGAWTPELGRDARRLARAGHDATEHARALVELLIRLGAPTAPPETALELARLARAASRAEGVCAPLALQLKEERTGRDHDRADRDRATARAAQLEAALAELRGRHEAVVSSRRWRIAGLIGRPLDRVRARLRGRRAG